MIEPKTAGQGGRRWAKEKGRAKWKLGGVVLSIGIKDQISIKTPNPKCRLFKKIDQ
jgi:hypothetical protein